MEASGPMVEDPKFLVLKVSTLMRSMAGKQAASFRLISGPERLVQATITVTIDDAAMMGEVRVTETSNSYAREYPDHALDHTIEMVAKPCRFGGKRWYFACPYTGRLCLTVYLPDDSRGFMGRQPHWAYRTQRTGDLGRKIATLTRLFAKLGAEYSGPYSPIPPRPTRMRRQTYADLKRSIEILQVELQPLWNQWLGKEVALLEPKRRRNNR